MPRKALEPSSIARWKGVRESATGLHSADSLLREPRLFT